MSQHDVRAQLMQVHPENISDVDLVLENRADLLAALGITKAQSFICHTAPCNDKQWELHYEVHYNAQGLPIAFLNGSAARAEAIAKAPGRERFGSRWQGACIFKFRYGTANELIAVEKYSWGHYHPFSRAEELTEFTYDAQGRCIKQQHTRRTIHGRGLKYRGTTYANDTSTTTLVFDYGLDGLVTGIRRLEDPSRTDTIFTSAAMDTTFFAPDTGSVADRTIEQCIPTGHARLINGNSMSLYDPHSTCMRYTYSEGQLSCQEIVSSAGKTLSRMVFRYADSGLLEAVDDPTVGRLRYLKYTSSTTYQ